MNSNTNPQTQVRHQIWAGTTWRTVAEAAHAAGVAIQDVQSWIRSNRVIALDKDGVTLLPAYQFDAQGMPLAAIAKVFEEFDGIFGGMGVAAFFESASNFLGGAKPRELVLSQPGRVLAAAKFNADTVRYG